jgi:hypothetical protein
LRERVEACLAGGLSGEKLVGDSWKVSRVHAAKTWVARTPMMVVMQ